MGDAGIEIGAMEPGDWPRVAEIYAEGIRTGESTFETAVPSWERWDDDHLPGHRWVARRGAEVLGWAALSRTSIREVYRGVAECSVYVAQEARGEGVGEALLDALAAGADADGIWTLEAVVFPREPGERGDAAEPRLPRGGHPRAPRPAPRAVARRAADRAPGPGRLNGRKRQGPSSVAGTTPMPSARR